MEGERRHKQAKQGETCKMTSAARCSRNSRLQRHRLQREKNLAESFAFDKASNKNKFMPWTGLAAKELPSALPRPRGQRLGEPEEPAASRRRVEHRGDPEALRRHREENEDRLRREAAAMREPAKQSGQARPLPFLNQEWQQFLSENRDAWQDLMRSAIADRRRLNEKQTPMSELPPAPRLQPVRTATPPFKWLKKLLASPDGFFALGGRVGAPASQRLVMFSCSLLKQCWALPLARLGPQRYVLYLKRVRSDFRPAQGALDSRPWANDADNVVVYELRLEFVGTDDRGPMFRAAQASEVPDAVLESKKCAEEGEEDGGDVAEASDSVLQSCQSSLEQEAEGAAEEADAEDGKGSDDDGEDGGRAAARTWTTESNGYFTFSDHPGWPDARARIAPRWRKPGEMGTKGAHKTATCHHYGEDKDSPRPITNLVLRAWTVWRIQQHGFHTKNPCRLRWIADQMAQLRRGVAALAHPSGRTGSPKADGLIQKWSGLFG
ncbi:unnamed protein product [Prorocentrum cordatum]|uniref:Uncharacterized protein n=1 Tax=Prorocentrum cordatum TaxID=2364126 RepID=A0ABN9VQ99_9DINO|nr:unnamed protein product [Polarella glacialis]